MALSDLELQYDQEYIPELSLLVESPYTGDKGTLEDGSTPIFIRLLVIIKYSIFPHKKLIITQLHKKILNY
jgi:hypothetical protein